MKCVAIVQARMQSTRLPGKILLPLGQDTVLAAVVGRLRRAQGVDEVWIATTDQPADEQIVAEARRLGVPFHRGSEQDVLARYRLTAAAAHADVILRITSDCPLIDPGLVGEMLRRFVADPACDYLSNVLQRSYPRGLDTEIMRRAALEQAFAQAVAAEEREHVTPYLHRHPESFRLVHHVGSPDLSGYRWTLDTPDDYAMLSRLVALVGADWMSASYSAIAAVLEKHPEVAAINQAVRQKTLGH